MRLITGGRIFTADPEQPWAEALVIHGDRIAYVGTHEAAASVAGPDAVVTDISGQLALPGFVDAHAHLLMTGDSLGRAQLRDAPDLTEIQARVAAWALAHPEAPRVLGVSWQFSAVPGGAPTKEMLDAIVSDRPAYLDANDLHSTWVNSRALEELGITADTPDPIGGAIARDPITGEATGHLIETAASGIAWPMLARVDDAERDRQLATALEAYRTSGTTTAVDMALNAPALAAMARAEAAGTLDVRIVGHWHIARHEDPAEELAQVARAAELARTYISERLRVIGIKVIVDGTIDGCTAALIEPYSSGANANPIWDDESLRRVVTAADAAGLQVALHAIGDRAVRSAIDAIEDAVGRSGRTDHRHRIEHLEYVDAADIGRLGALGITASMQPVHCDPSIIDNWEQMLGHERANEGFAWPRYVETGATLAFGTDTPTAPHFPLENMYIGTTRKSPSNGELRPHRPDFALPLSETILHGTRDAAWSSFLEGRVGTLRVGMLADLVIIDRDPFGDGPQALLTAQVVETISGGRTVHRVRQPPEV